MIEATLSTEAGGGLRIGAYPGFRYDGRGGGGSGTCGASDPQGWCPIRFDPAGLTIPPLNRRTTRFLGLPLPPGLAIRIQPSRLEGRWQPRSGCLELRFEAQFRFLVLDRQAAPDLFVAAAMSTGRSAGERHSGEGRRLDGQGRGVLVGIARVEPTGTAWYDRFLGLPDEALATLPCRLLLAESAAIAG